MRTLPMLAAACLGLCRVTMAQAAEDPAALAQRILQATGVRGGLAVHVECGDGRLTAALRAHEGLLVQGLARNRAEVQRARAWMTEAGLYGPVSVDRWDGANLPYADNLVNLLVCGEAGAVPLAEATRVLAPNGVAYLRRDGEWQATVKPRPDDMDEWTHALHDSAGNPVAHDAQVGPPKGLRWVAGPRWARHHDHMASMTSFAAAGGRVFYVFDEGSPASIQLPSEWRLIARDAYNGTLLWKRDLPAWNTRQWPLKSGPAHLLRRLVAVGERVYVTLGLEAPVSALDAATGETVLTYEGSERTGEILVSGDTLLAIVSADGGKLLQWQRRDTYVWDNSGRANRDWAWNGEAGSLAAYNAASGALRWRVESPVAPCSPAADAERVVFYDGARLVALGLRDGGRLWESEPIKATVPVATSTGIRVLLHQDVVLLAGNNGTITAVSAADGRKLWEAPHLPSGHQSLRDLFVVNGLVWTGAIAASKDPGNFVGYDLHTGEVKSEIACDVDTYWFHHRCYPAKATDRYLLASRTGIEYIDLQAKHWEPHHWVRGGCITGVFPCNGLTYAPMNSCGCYLESKLCGLNALSAVPAGEAAASAPEARLERGPAYDREAEADADPGDWPTYRHDEGRSGATPAGAAIPDDAGWRADLGGRLTPPVIAGGRLYAAATDRHTVHALDAATGRALWGYTAGGRIDSPPTVHRGLVLFGSADGYVYALRAGDGALAWRFRAAPSDRRIVAYDQVESAWPVHGSVLVHAGALYCTAGRSVFLDGGIRLLKLDPLTGRLLSETVMDERDPATGENLQVHVSGLTMPVALSDVLSCDGEHLYMRSQKIDLDGNRLEIPIEKVEEQPAEGSHLFCETGLLDDSWFHRSYWLFGRRVSGGYGSWFQAARLVPAGRILAFDDRRVYGYGQKPEYFVNASVLEYQLFAAERNVTPEDIQRVNRANAEMNARLDKGAANASDWKLRRYFPVEDLTAARFPWRVDQPSLHVRALALAGDTLFVAGPPDLIDEREAFRLPDDPDVQSRLQQQAEALEGRHGGRLWVVSATDGAPLARYALPSPPVFDGLAAARGRVYVVTVDGAVACLGKAGLLPVEEAEPWRTISDEPEEPGYLKPPEVDKSADFGTLVGCRVVEGPLGYRVKPKESGALCLALQEPATPLTGQVTLTCKLRVQDDTGFLQNGFIAFGDGPADERLVKCGIRFRNQDALLVQGPLTGGKAQTAKVEAPIGSTVELTVTVDLDRQRVSFTTRGVTLEAPLERRLEAITHVGYCTDNAIADASPLQ